MDDEELVAAIADTRAALKTLGRVARTALQLAADLERQLEQRIAQEAEREHRYPVQA